MPIVAGTMLGRYEIISLLGHGGMGEVYRAKDTRLNRDVAIKVLTSELSDNQQLRQRFEREARAISSLNHPHICAMYDIGREKDLDYLVMEFLEGETLAQRLATGPMPLEDVFRYGIQVAQALDKAHSQGIVHRDLKPGNIMLTRSGAKLLDFGLAKLLDSNAFFTTVSHEELTVSGTLLGTPQYMSPEQLHGNEADARSDIFALGALLFEMVTGRKAFEGKTQASIITAILTQEPPAVSALEQVSPPELDRLIQTCLAKDPEYRWQRAQDIVNQISSLAQGRYPSKTWIPLQRPGQKSLVWKLIAALAAIAFVIVLGLYVTRPRLTTSGLIRFEVPPPASHGSTRSMAISPNGKLLAFVCTDPSGKDFLWIRSLDSYTNKMMQGTEDARYPFWSPDSRYVGFFAQSKLKKVDVNDGFVQGICETTLARGGTWNRKNTIVFSKNPEDGLYSVSAAGGTPAELTRLDSTRKETTHRWPQFLPDDNHFLYYVMSSDPRKNGIYAGSLDSHESKQIMTSDWRGVYAPPGYLIFTQQGKVFAQKFDSKSLQLKGEPYSLTEFMWHDSDISGFTSLSFSDNSILASWPGRDLTSQPVRMNRSGEIVKRIGAAGNIFDFSLSPDNEKIAACVVDPDTLCTDIWIEDLVRGSRSRLTVHPRNEITPVWAPDSDRLVFSSDRSGLSQLYLTSVNAMRNEKQITQSEGWKYPYTWSPDGAYLLYDVSKRSQFDIWALNMEKQSKEFPFVETEFGELDASFSPDSKWVVYSSDESGNAEIFIQGFPPPGKKFQVSVAGGSRPVWRSDGKEILFLSPNEELMSAEITFDNQTPQAGIPRPLFRFPAGALKSGSGYSVLADGSGVIVNLLVNPQSNPPLHVVLNWAEGLK